MESYFSHPKQTNSLNSGASKTIPTNTAETNTLSTPAVAQGQGGPGGDGKQDAIKLKNKFYDSQKRKRTFQDSWKTIYGGWLRFDEEKNEMSCESFPKLADTTSSLFVGSNNFRIDSLAIHNTNLKHVRCVDALKARENPGTAPLRMLLTSIPEATNDRLLRLFRTAYYIAKNGRPFSDFKGLCELQNLNGANLGQTYLNDHKCAEFVEAISDHIKDALCTILTDGRSFSLMCDGSTDSGKINIEESAIKIYKFINIKAKQK